MGDARLETRDVRPWVAHVLRTMLHRPIPTFTPSPKEVPDMTETTDKVRGMVRDGKLEPADAEEVLRFAAFLRNAGRRDCTCDKGAISEDGTVIRHAHVPPNTLAYARGEDVDPEGTEQL